MSYYIFNNFIGCDTFSQILKKADLIAVYRPVSTLSNFSKNFEKLIYLQLNNYIEKDFPIYLTGFRKNNSNEHALL